MGQLTHQERRNRREAIAKRCCELRGSGYSNTKAQDKTAGEFQVSVATVVSACREFYFTNTNTQSNDEQATSDDASREVPLSPKTVKILDLLKNTELTYKDISEQAGCTKQNVQIIHKRYLSLGHDLPTRQEIMERKNIAKQQVVLLKDKDFVARYIETNHFEQSAIDAGISFVRARKVLRAHELTQTGLIFDRNTAKTYRVQRITGRWLYVMADVLAGTMNATQIAEKWKKPIPFVFNLMAECRAAGITLPELPDGRSNARRNVTSVPNLCKDCGKEIVTRFVDENGIRVRADLRRVKCLECSPYIPRKLPQTNSSNDSDLQEVDEISEQNG